ncbi:MAG: transposase, partial [Armatimonadia bacterium]
MSCQTFVGIDVSKAQLEVAGLPSGRRHFDNTPQGVAELVRRLTPLAPELTVLEATGGYERLAACALADAKLPVVVANPRQVRHFAKGQGLLAKTDKIDAAVLALFAEHVQPAVRMLPEADLVELRALLMRRGQLLEMQQMERNRLPLTTP